MLNCLQFQMLVCLCGFRWVVWSGTDTCSWTRWVASELSVGVSESLSYSVDAVVVSCVQEVLVGGAPVVGWDTGPRCLRCLLGEGRRKRERLLGSSRLAYSVVF